MLPREHRLTKMRDFNRVHKKGRFTGNGPVSVKTVKNNLPVSRFAFLVSTKVSKKAPERNLLKRRLREITRELLGGVTPGFDVVVMTQAKLLDLEYADLHKQIAKLYKKARIVS